MSELVTKSKERVKISKEEFTSKVKSGSNIKELSTFYGIPRKEIKEIGLTLGLTFSRKKVKYELA